MTHGAGTHGQVGFQEHSHHYDDEVAATKIQSLYRGRRVRRGSQVCTFVTDAEKRRIARLNRRGSFTFSKGEVAKSPAELGVELLQVAIQKKGDDQMVAIKALLAAGADVEMLNEEGETALSLFVKANHLLAAQAVLCQPGCDVNRVHPETGQTALHVAYAERFLGMARLLLRRGAGPSLLIQDRATFTKAALYPRQHIQPKWQPPPPRRPKDWEGKMKALLTHVPSGKRVGQELKTKQVKAAHYTSNNQDIRGLDSMVVLLQREFVDRRQRTLARLIQTQAQMGPNGFPIDQLEMFHKIFCSLAGNTRTHAVDGFLTLRGFGKLTKAYNVHDHHVIDRLFTVHSKPIKAMGEDLRHHDTHGESSGILFEGALKAVKFLLDGPGTFSMQRKPYLQTFFQLVDDSGGDTALVLDGGLSLAPVFLLTLEVSQWWHLEGGSEKPRTHGV